MPQEELIQDPSNIRLNEQNEIQSILGRPPGWILQWGITFVFVAVIVMLTIGWMVKFPDIIPARVTLTTEVPPVHLFSRVDGKLTDLLVKDKENVDEGALLAVIENPANWRDIQELEDFLVQLNAEEEVDLAEIDPPVNLVLGELQPAFSKFTQNLNDYTFFKNKDEVKKKIQALKSQIRYLGRMNVSLKKQQVTLEEESNRAKENLNRNQLLKESGSVSQQEVEAAEVTVLQYKRQIEKLPSEILQNKLRIKELEVKIIDLRTSRTDGSNAKEIGLQENIERLQNSIEQWKQTYLIVAPIEGTVSFSKVINAQQYITKNEEVMTIVPSGGVGEIVGKGLLPITGLGKVEEGATANIRLDGYPYQEFGSVEATILSKSLVPQEGGMYLLEIDLPNKLITTYGKEIAFQQEMQGTARIITEDRTVLDRVFDKFLDAFKNR